MSTIQNYHAAMSVNAGFTVPRLKCKSGLEMSVQASEIHYSSPRENRRDGSFSSFEVGFPTEKVEALMEYAESPEMPTNTVYGGVPFAVIDAIIEDNGGLI